MDKRNRVTEAWIDAAYLAIAVFSAYELLTQKVRGMMLLSGDR